MVVCISYNSLPTFKKFWQVDFVEDEDPMYQINDLPIFKLKCSAWEYGSDLVDTGVTEIDEKCYSEVDLAVLEEFINHSLT